MKKGLLLFVTGAALVLVLGCYPLRGARASAIDMAWVNEKLAAWNPSQWKPMNFTMQLGRASYGNLLRPCNTLEVLNANLAFCEGANPTSIRIDMGFDAFATNNTQAISNLDAIVSLIKAHNRKLIIADAAREYYWNHKQPWSQFAQEWIDRVGTLAQRYQPDYYIVIKEPGWYARMILDLQNPAVTTAATWVNLLDTLNKTVKNVSPNTKTGISIDAGALAPTASFSDQQIQLMIDAPRLTSTDLIGFDLYVKNSYAVVQQFLEQNGSGGKEIWFAEMWSGTAAVAFDPARAAVDQRWIQAAYDFAVLEKASEMSMFFSDAMCDYSINTISDPQTLVSYYQTHREPSYSTYAAIIQGQIPYPGL